MADIVKQVERQVQEQQVLEPKHSIHLHARHTQALRVTQPATEA